MCLAVHMLQLVLRCIVDYLITVLQNCSYLLPPATLIRFISQHKVCQVPETFFFFFQKAFLKQLHGQHVTQDIKYSLPASHSRSFQSELTLHTKNTQLLFLNMNKYGRVMPTEYKDFRCITF